MSSYIATAFVKISPDLTGFREELRKQTQSAVSQVGKREVLITPSLKGFSTELRTKVRKSIEAVGPQNIPFNPQLGAFRQRFNEELRKNPLTIPIHPDMVAFRKELEEKVAAVNRGLKVTIPVVTGAGVAGGEGTGGKQRETTATQALEKAERKLLGVRTEGIALGRQADAALKLEAGSEARLSALRSVSTAAAKQKEVVEKALIRADLERDSGLKRLLRAERTSLNQMLKAVGTEQRLEERTKARARATVRQAAASTTLTAKERQQLAVEQRLAAQEAALAPIRDANNRARILTNQAIAKTSDLSIRERAAKQALEQTDKALLGVEYQLDQVRQGTADKTLPKILQREKERLLSDRQFRAGIVESINLEKDRAKAQDLAANATQSFNKTSAFATKEQIKSLTTLADIKDANIVLTKAEKTVTTAIAAAKETENVARVQSLTLMQDEIVRRKALVATQKDEIKSTIASASAWEFRRRGVISTLASLAGVRGATLAANAQFLAGAIAVAAFAKAVQGFANLERELNVFAATAEATGDEMERASKLAIELGADVTLPGVAAGDAAKSFTELAKAGLSVEDSLAGARGVLQLATAGEIENAEATQLVASALNAFGLAGIEAVRVADLLAGAAIESQGSIQDMGIALQQSSAAARQAGISLEDTIALLTLLARNGIRGSDAGTALRTALLRLIRPTQQSGKRLAQLNVAIRDAQGNIRPEAFAELANALSDVDRAQRDATIAMIFGQDAFRAAAIFGREGAAGLNLMRDETQKQGLAAKLAAAQTTGLSGSFEALRNALSTLGTNLGGFVSGPLKSVIDGFAAAANAGNAFLERLKEINDELEDTPGIKQIKVAVEVPVDAARKDWEAFRDFVEEDSKKINEFLDFALGQLQGDAEDVAKQVQAIFATFRKSARGPTALNEAALALVDLIAVLKNGNEEAQRLAAEVEVLLKVLQETGKLPPIKLRVDEFLMPDETPPVKTKAVVTFEADFPKDSIFAIKKPVEDAARESSKAFLSTFGGVLSPEAARAIGFPFGVGLVQGASAGISETIKTVPKLSLEDFLTIQEARGAPQGETLANLRARERRQQARFEELDAIVNRTRFQQQKWIKAGQELEATRAAIKSIVEEQAQAEEEQAQKAKDAADKAEEARDKADAALLRGFDVAEQRARNKLLIAQQTERLSDDIKANIVIKKLLRRQIQIARARIKDLETRRETIRDLRQERFEIGQEIKDLRRQEQERIASVREEARDRIRESIELDIEFASTKENVRKEIAARKRLIAQLHKWLAQEKPGTLAYKRIRNEIADQVAAIKELQGALKDRNNAFLSLQFEFLQAQQGFAANLFGNLLPIGSAAGLVGNVSPTTPSVPGQDIIEKIKVPRGADLPTGPQGPLTRAQARAAQAGGGARAQGNTEIELLRQIVEILSRIDRGAGHPEARRARISQRSSMETLPHGI